MGFRVSAEDETTGVDFTQHAETAYAEGVHGHQPSRRPPLGDLGTLEQRPDTADEDRTETSGGLNGRALPVVDPSKVEVPASSGRRSCRGSGHDSIALSKRVSGCNARADQADEVSSCRLVRNAGPNGELDSVANLLEGSVDIVLGVSMTPTTVRMVLVEGEKADGVIVDHDAFDITVERRLSNTRRGRSGRRGGPGHPGERRRRADITSSRSASRGVTTRGVGAA